MKDLVLFHGPGDSLADRLAAAAQARVLVDLVKDAQKHADTALRDTVEELSATTGTAFTARGDGPLAGWSAQITAPQPKPYVSNRDAFALWWEEQGWDCKTTEHVEVVDHVRAAEALALIDADGDLAAAATKLYDSLWVRVDILLPEGAEGLAALECDPSDDGSYVHRATGEMVPGLEWRQQSPQLRVVGSKEAKAAGRRQVCDLLGVDQAAIGGDL